MLGPACPLLRQAKSVRFFMTNLSKSRRRFAGEGLDEILLD
jgi:hypothetical protein